MKRGKEQERKENVLSKPGHTKLGEKEVTGSRNGYKRVSIGSNFVIMCSVMNSQNCPTCELWGGILIAVL